MRKQLFFLILIPILFLLTASMNPSEPDRFVKFEENLFVSKFELTNGEYKLFQNETKSQNDFEKLKLLQPDSSLWTSRFSFSFNEPYTNLYHWHPSYNNYPVVNLKKEAIESFCEWKTLKYNSDPKREYKKVVFRLPTETEWMKFSKPFPDHRLPWYENFPYRINSKNQLIFLANLKVKNYATDNYDFNQDGALITLTVGSYEPNNLGLYDIIGNVSECTTEGKVKGGSWDNTLAESFIDTVQNFSTPDPRVGFRLVMEILEK